MDAAVLPLIVHLAVQPAVYPSGRPVVVSVAVTNPGSAPVDFTRYFTPFEPFAGPIFAVVAADGVRVPYTGPMVKRKPPGKKDLIRIAAGETLRVDVDLAQAWAFPGPGTYDVTFTGANDPERLPGSNTLKVVLE